MTIRSTPGRKHRSFGESQWRRSLVGILGVALLISGCSALPGDTPPQSLGPFQRSPIAFEPPRPAPNRSPDLILRDFLRAAAVPTDHAASRRFLTDKANLVWRKHTDITVVERTDVNTVASPEPGRLILQMRVRTLGTVDSEGAFTSNPSTDIMDVEMVLQGDQWLIDRFPNQLLVDWEAFLATYESQAIYYLDTTGSRVVPDPRWMYAQGTATPNMLVQLLVRSPSEQLHNIVASELPPTARISAVPGAQGNGVDVKISHFTAGSEASRRRLVAQIVFTFERARIHGPYYITVDGRPLDPSHSDGWTSNDVRQFDPMYTTLTSPVPLHAITADGLMKVGKELTPVQGELGTSQDLRSASFSRGGKMVAAVMKSLERGKGPMVLKMGHSGGKLLTALKGESFSRPSWAPSGQVAWVVANGSTVKRVSWQDGNSVLVTDVDTHQLRLRGDISDLRISPDGVRVAYLSGGKLYIAVIDYERDGAVRLVNPRRLNVGRDEMIMAVDWRTARELLVGGSEPEQPVVMVSLDGASITLFGGRNITVPVTVVVANPQGIYVRDNRNVLRLEQGSEGFWQDVPALVASPRATPVLEG